MSRIWSALLVGWQRAQDFVGNGSLRQDMTFTDWVIDACLGAHRYDFHRALPGTSKAANLHYLFFPSTTCNFCDCVHHLRSWLLAPTQRPTRSLVDVSYTIICAVEGKQLTSLQHSSRLVCTLQPVSTEQQLVSAYVHGFDSNLIAATPNSSLLASMVCATSARSGVSS
jgi:hypothetical protein